MARSTVGFSTAEVARATRLTVRQIAYWVVTFFVVPSVANPRGRGNGRRYSILDVLAFAVLAAMREQGVSLQALRSAQRYLRNRSGRELQNVHAQLVWAPGNRRYRHDIALVHSKSEIESLLAVPGQQVSAVVVPVGEIFQQVRERLEEIRSERRAKSEDRCGEGKTEAGNVRRGRAAAKAGAGCMK